MRDKKGYQKSLDIDFLCINPYIVIVENYPGTTHKKLLVQRQ